MLDISNKYSTSWQCEKIVKLGSKKRFFFFTIFSQSPRKTHKKRANLSSAKKSAKWHFEQELRNQGKKNGAPTRTRTLDPMIKSHDQTSASELKNIVKKCFVNCTSCSTTGSNVFPVDFLDIFLEWFSWFGSGSDSSGGSSFTAEDEYNEQK